MAGPAPAPSEAQLQIWHQRVIAIAGSVSDAWARIALLESRHSSRTISKACRQFHATSLHRAAEICRQSPASPGGDTAAINADSQHYPLTDQRPGPFKAAATVPYQMCNLAKHVRRLKDKLTSPQPPTRHGILQNFELCATQLTNMCEMWASENHWDQVPRDNSQLAYTGGPPSHLVGARA